MGTELTLVAQSGYAKRRPGFEISGWQARRRLAESRPQLDASSSCPNGCHNGCHLHRACCVGCLNLPHDRAGARSRSDEMELPRAGTPMLHDRGTGDQKMPVVRAKQTKPGSNANQTGGDRVIHLISSPDNSFELPSPTVVVVSIAPAPPPTPPPTHTHQRLADWRRLWTRIETALSQLNWCILVHKRWRHPALARHFQGQTPNPPADGSGPSTR